MIDAGVANAVDALKGITGGYQSTVSQVVQQAADAQAKQRALQAAAQAQQQAQLQQAQQAQAMAQQEQKMKLLQTQLTAQQKAQQMQQQGAGGYGPTATGHPSGNVKSWIDQALQVLHLGPQYESGLYNMIEHESGGNPGAINRTDSNARAGHPSQGLMQTIPGTFAAYALPGYNKNILDPVSNIIAGARYALSRYGSGMLLAGGRRDANGNYIGY